MGDELRSAEVRGMSFDVVRRGYDREAVDRFRTRIADHLETLEGRVADLESRLDQMGLSDVADLRAELETVGADVASILEAARRAAAEMRERAAADAARWRAEADADTRRQRREAQAEAEAMRRDAWETGTTMLAQAEEERQRLVDTADQDALFIRAEAEREALRLTGDARRDAEEELRAARTEGERALAAARAESESTIAAARRSAELAEERARALEQRRIELLEELEGARRDIGGLHTVESTPANEAAPPPHSAADWLEDDASVRIVPAASMPVDEPVDADSLVAEVEQLRRAVEVPVATAETVPVEDEVAPHVVEAPVPPEAQPESELEQEPSAELEQARQLEPLEPPPSPEPEPESQAEHAPAAEEEVEGPAEPEPELEPETEGEPEPSVLDDLFAELRTAEEAAPGPETEVEAEGVPAPQAEPVVEPEPAPARVAVADEPVPSPDAAPAAIPMAGLVDPFDLRSRLLLPIENRTLRAVKRRILDLQNRVLEELRVGGETWVPDRPMFAGAMGDDLDRLVQESQVAGYAGAAELLGKTATPRPERAVDDGATTDFVEALFEAVTEALSRTRTSGGGVRQVSAAVSRVFRAWRTDQAERRIRLAALTAYHHGLLGGFERLGVERVTALAPGQPCGRCPAGTGAAWQPGGPLPEGRALPPAAPSCEATVVPVE